MTTGDEPQLGGQPADDAPMISGAVRKAIADARGAYLVGNIQALWNRMSEAQRLSFRQAVVRQAVYYAERYIGQDARHEAARACLDAARGWLETVSDDYLEALRRTSARLSPTIQDPYDPEYDPYEPNPNMPDIAAGYVVCATESWAPDYIWAAVQAAEVLAHLGYVPVDPGAESHGLRWAARRWQVEAAWAILNGRPLPLLDTAIPTGMEGWYVQGQLWKLLQSMTEAQRLTWQRAVVQQTIWYAEKSPLPPEDRDVGQRACVQAARRWLEQPSPEHAEAARHASQRGLGCGAAGGRSRGLLDVGRRRQPGEMRAATLGDHPGSRRCCPFWGGRMDGGGAGDGVGGVVADRSGVGDFAGPRAAAAGVAVTSGSCQRQHCIGMGWVIRETREGTVLQLTVAILISAIMAILGLINIFFKDLAWEWTEWSNRNRGVVSERTSAWEAASTLSGIMLVVLGVALLVLSLSVWGR